MLDVALATSAGFPNLDVSDTGLLDALSALGLKAEACIWDDPGVRFEEAALTVVRSTWDYSAHRERFLAWARSVPRLMNPAQVLEVNTDKTYLIDLHQAGVPIAPTTVVDSLASLAALMAPTAPIVVKPTVGAGSRGVAMFEPKDFDEARHHAARLLDQGTAVLVQRYLDAVERTGEATLIFFLGQFSHGITKPPMLDPVTGTGEVATRDRARWMADLEAYVPSHAELEVAQQCLEAARATEVLYARVDLLPGDDGPVVGELELTEPCLFLTSAPGAAERFARAIVRTLEG